MRTTQSKFDFKIRKIKRYSDISIISGLRQTLFFRRLFLKEGRRAWYDTFQDYRSFLIYLFALVPISALRRKFGAATHGLILTFMGANLIMVYNSIHIPILLKPIAVFFTPLFIFWKSPEELLQYATIDVHSETLVALMILFVLLSFIHLIVIYIGFPNSSQTKRGESWVFTFLSKLSMVLGKNSRRWFLIFLSRIARPAEYFVYGILEPAIVSSFAYFLLKYDNDIYGAVFLWICAAAVALQQLLDKSEDMKSRSILDL